MDDPDPARSGRRRAAEIPGFPAIARRHQPEYAVRPAEAPRRIRRRRAALLRAAPAARRISADRERSRARPGAEGAARLGTRPHAFPALRIFRHLARRLLQCSNVVIAPARLDAGKPRFYRRSEAVSRRLY